MSQEEHPRPLAAGLERGLRQPLAALDSAPKALEPDLATLPEHEALQFALLHPQEYFVECITSQHSQRPLGFAIHRVGEATADVQRTVSLEQVGVDAPRHELLNLIHDEEAGLVDLIEEHNQAWAEELADADRELNQRLLSARPPHPLNEEVARRERWLNHLRQCRQRLWKLHQQIINTSGRLQQDLYWSWLHGEEMGTAEAKTARQGIKSTFRAEREALERLEETATTFPEENKLKEHPYR